jgi:hypothetical protein
VELFTSQHGFSSHLYLLIAVLSCYSGVLKRMCKVSLTAGKNQKIPDVLSTVCPLPLAHTSSAWRDVDVADILEHFDGHFFNATELA